MSQIINPQRILTINDSEVLPELLDQIPEELKQVSGDGVYDTFDCYDAIAQRQAHRFIQ